MPDFVSDETTLFADKVEDGGATSAGRMFAADANALRDAAYDLRTHVTALETAPTPIAFGATFGSDWTKGTSADAPRYYKQNGRVYLMGLVVVATGGFEGGWSIFDTTNGLPSGYRPAATRRFTAVLLAASDATSINVDIDDDGSVSISLSDPAQYSGLSAGDAIYLDGINFLAEQ